MFISVIMYITILLCDIYKDKYRVFKIREINVWIEKMYMQYEEQKREETDVEK